MDGIRFIDRLNGASAPGAAPPRAPQPVAGPPAWTADGVQISQSPAPVPAVTFGQRMQVAGIGQTEGVRAPRSTREAAHLPAWQQVGDAVAQVAESRGFVRGQVIRDTATIDAMLDEASRLYGVPAEWLRRLAERETGGQHWDAQGKVKEGAAVGLLQIERRPHPELVQGGAANARHNAYDLANNIAIGAQFLRRHMDRLVRESGYQGQNPWGDLGPLVEFSYSAGRGALRSAQTIARERGLDPWDWQHLLLGRNWQGVWTSSLQIPPGWLTTSPMATAIDRLHAKNSSYPRAWTGAGAVRRFDFDGDGQAHKVERMLARTLHMVYGLQDPRPAGSGR